MRGILMVKSRLWSRFGFAVLAALAALLLRLPFNHLVQDRAPYFTFFLGTVASAGFGGFWSGVVTMLLSLFLAEVFVFRPYVDVGSRYLADPAGVFRFFFSGIFVSYVCSALIASRERARQARAAEQEARLLYQQTLAGIDDGVISTDAGGNLRFMNSAGERITGWTAVEALGVSLGTVLQLERTDPGPAPSESMDLVLQGRATIAFSDHTILITRGGERLSIEGTAAPVPGETGHFAGAVVVIRDVTERRLSQENRRATEARLKLALAATRMIAWEWTVGGNTVVTAGDVEEIYGIVIRTTQDRFKLVHPNDLAQHEAEVMRIAGEGGTYRSEFRIVRPETADVVWLEERASALCDDSGRVLRLTGVTIDVTDQKRAQQKLKESERIYRAIGESIPYGIWMADANGRHLYASDALLELIGMKQEECLGFDWTRALHPDDERRILPLWQECIRTHGIWDVELRFRGTDGDYYPVLARGVPVEDEEGRVLCWAGIHLDIRRLKQVEHTLQSQTAELERSNKELEQFAYVASHDLQEPLRMVNIYVELLMRRLNDQLPQEARDHAAFVRQGVAKMSSLIRDLLAFSRAVHSEAQDQTVDANEAVRQALEMCEVAIRDAAAEVQIAGLPAVIAQEGPLVQVFQNLLSNSIKYRKPGVPARVRVGSEMRGEDVLIYVADEGIGFHPNYAETIFGLFKRLHSDQYPGTGLGLAICQRIVEQYGGRIWAESAPGEGSTFYFTLRPAPGTASRTIAAESYWPQ
jgi:PAS domain S-box-containing protein